MRYLEIKYKAVVKDTNSVFDLSEKPKVVPLGAGLLHDFVEKALEKVKPGKTYKFEFEKPFGDRDENKIKLVPLSEFTRRKIKPIPGLIVKIDGKRGIIRSVSGGRVTVDFNHPLAGKDLYYEVEVIKEVTDLEDKIKGLIEFLFEIDRENIEVQITDKKIRIKVLGKDLPERHWELLEKYIPELKDYEKSSENIQK